MKFIYILFVCVLLGSLEASQKLSVKNEGANSKTLNYYFIEDIKNPKIDINFEYKIFPTEKVGSFTNEKIMLCDKNLGGSFEYLSENSVRLYPENQLKTSQTFNCKLNKELFPKKLRTIIIKTKEFKLKQSDIKPYGDKFMIKLEFNDKVNFNSVAKAIYLETKKSVLDYQIYPKKDSFRYSLIFSSNLTKFELTIDGLENSSKNPMDRVSKTFDTQKLTNLFLQSYDIKDFPIEDRYSYDDGSIYLEFLYQGKILNKNIRDYIEISPKVDFYITKYRSYWDDESRLKFYGNFNPNIEYEIKFKKGLKFKKDDVWEKKILIHKAGIYELKDDVVKTVLTKDRGAFIGFDKEENYISSKAKSIIINSSNVYKTKIVAEKLIKGNYRYFINFAEDYEFYKYSDIIFDKEVNLNCEKNEICKTKLNLKNILKGSGIYKIKLYSDEYNYKSKYIYLSDIAISAKLYKNEILISTSSLATNAPIHNADVRVYDNKNRLLAFGRSDYQGIFRAKIKDLPQKEPKSVVVSYEREENFLYLKNATALNLNIIDNPPNFKKIESFIYLDREIARPNDEINALFVLKNLNFKSVKNAPLKIKILDPIGSEIMNEVIKTDDFGIVEKLINIPNSYKTGRYKIFVYWFKEKVGYKEFMVEDFIPQKIKNEISINKVFYEANEPIKLEAKSSYLFGAPASELKAEVVYSTVKKEFKNSKFKGYSFSSKNKFEQSEYIEMVRVNKDVILDKEGKVNLIFENKFKKVPSILQGMIALTVFDDGRGVSKYKTFNVFPYKSMVGIKRLNEGYADSGVVEKFKIALIDNQAEKLPNRKLQLEVKKAIWQYRSGSYSIETIKKDIVDSDKEFKFTPKSSGNYMVKITDPIDGHSATTSFYVSGWSYDPVNNKEAKQIEIMVDDKKYKAGEQMKVGLKAPLAGRLIITMEDEKIHHYQVVNMPNNTATFNIQIPYSIKNNFYITAYIVRDTKEDNRAVPFRAFGKKFIKIDKTEYKVNINIETLKKYESNRKVKFQVKSDTKNGYVILSMVDMGILNIIGQTPPKPFKFFLLKPYNISSIYDFYNNLLSHISKTILKQGSGESLHNKMKKHLPPDSLTKRVKPFSFYSKKIKIVDGVAEIVVDIPNFNGQARIVAIVVDKDKIGAFSKEVIVKDDVIIKPTYPRFLSIGDELKIPVRVFNTTDLNKTITLKVSKTNSKASLINNKIKVSSHSSVLQLMDLKALNSPAVSVKIDAKDDTFHTYFHKVDIPTKSTKALKTFSKGGETIKDVEFSIKQKVFDTGKPRVNVMISKTMLSQFNGDFDSLIQYPYGCAEQTSSKILAMLNIDKFLDKNSSDYKKKVQKNRFMILVGINKLARMQKNNGQFTYWKNGNYVNDFASIYASDVLLMAKKRGFDIDLNMIDGIKKALNEYSRNSENEIKRLYSLYILSKQNKVDLALVNSLYDNKSYKKTLYGHYLMVALLNKMNLKDEAKKVYDEILNYDIYKNKSYRTYSGNFYSFIKDVAFSLSIHLENFPKDTMSERLFDIIVSYVKDKKLYSTQDKAFVLKALDSYYKGQKNSELDTIVTINSKTSKVSKAKIFKQPLKENLVKISPQNKTSVNYLIDIIAYDEYKIKKPNLKRDKLKQLTIDTNYYTDKGMNADLNNLKVGDKIYLEVKLNSKRELENVVVNAQIPSNLEIVNIRLNKEDNTLFESKNFDADFIDIRDDRELVFLTVKGKVKFYIPLRAVSKGKSKMPPILTEAMYDNRINDYSKKIDFVIVK